MIYFYDAVFYLLAILIVGTTGMAITRRDPVHAILYLIGSFMGTALLFYLLGAPLPAALEVIVYAGAIMVLFLFIVMTLKGSSGRDDDAFRRRWVLPAAMGTVAFLALAVVLFLSGTGGQSLNLAMASPAVFGRYVLERYWLPVEIVSLLLFVGLVGALCLGREDRRQSSPAEKEG